MATHFLIDLTERELDTLIEACKCVTSEYEGTSEDITKFKKMIVTLQKLKSSETGK